MIADQKEQTLNWAKQMQEAMESNRQALADAREAWDDERTILLKVIDAAKV